MSDYFLHETAIVDAGAQIGAGSKIWHFCHVMSKAVIGDRCILGQNVFVADNTRLGDGVKVQNNVSIYSNVFIEDDCFLGPSMVFTNVINPRAFVERKEEYKTTILKKGCSVGANATIVCGVELGAYSFVGAGCVVNQNVPAFAMVVGVPMEINGWMSKQGERLNFNDQGIAECPLSGETYKKLSEGEVIVLDEA